MLRYLSGIVQAVHDHELILAVGPLGLSLQVPKPTEFCIGQEIMLQAYMHWNQEQGPTLYGFMTELDRAVFLLIISCSGLGPKLALAVLTGLGAETCVQAIQTANTSLLSQISGVGPKKAEQMVTLLRDKVAKLVKSGILATVPGGTSLTHWSDVAQALESLSYTRIEVAAALKYMGDSAAGAHLSFDQLMRGALSFLAKKG